MKNLWEFFENLNEYVYVSDMDTYELVYMNRKLRELSGLMAAEDYVGKKCYEVLQQCSEPCAMCNNGELKCGQFCEWQYYNPVLNKNLFIKDSMVEEDGRRYRIEIAVDVLSRQWHSNVVRDRGDLEALANEALRVALKKGSPDESIAAFLEYIGKTLGSERTYVFERNEKGNDDNTYEWVAAGAVPEKDNLQDLPAEVCANWYRCFHEGRPVVIPDLEDIREDDPLQYENLKRQDIRSLYVVPLDDGERVFGFYGVDNPSEKYEGHISTILQMASHYIVSAIGRRNLILRLQQEEAEKTAAFYQNEISTALAARTQENLDMVNEIIGSGLWYMNFDEQGEMTNVCWSQTIRDMLGFTDTADFPDRLEAWSDRLHPADKAQTLASYWNCVAGLGDYDVKYRAKKKDGEYNWFHARGKVARYDDGTPRLFLGTFINITKDLMAQRALEEAYQAANRANAAKTAFMANMSHDIRTPLNAIIGMTAIAAMHLSEPDKLAHCLSEITASSKHLLGLVNEVLDMNKIESGAVSLNIEPLHLPDLIDNVLSVSAPLLEAKHHRFSIDIRDIQHEDVYGDKDRLQQCLMNFMGNAIKYTPDGGSIRLSISEKTTNRPKRGCYEFIVEDNGIGMSEDFLSRIFEPFTRSDDERVTKLQGAGLGMSITRNIIRMMNGDIKVESELDRGSRFTATVFLELQDAADEQLDSELSDLPILVADDDETACEGACHILDEMGMKSEWVLTGNEAVEKVVRRHEKGQDFFAVILDWKMPGMDGVAATRAIRAAVGDEVPIIIISAYDWSVIEAEAREAGADAFISKPLFKSRMVYVFRKLLGKAKETQQKNALDELSGTDFSGKRVLLAEDNAINAEIAEEVLGMTGLAVDHVWNGKEAADAMENAADGYYDLIFMDIQMPVMNGYEAAQTIRASSREHLRSIPIIAMSANAFAEDVQQSIKAGMNGHIAKPLDFDRLLTVLRDWIPA